METTCIDGGLWQCWMDVRTELLRYIAKAVQRVPCAGAGSGSNGSSDGLTRLSGSAIRAALARDEDLHDEVLFEVFQAILSASVRDRFPNEAEERRKWMWVVARRLAHRLALKRVRQMGASLDEPENSGTLPANDTTSPEDEARLRRALEEVEKCLTTLRPADVELLASAADGGALREYAESRGLPPGTVRSRISRARAKLQDRLSEHLELEAATRMDKAA